MQIIFFFLIRSSTYLQLLCCWLSFLILLHMLKPSLKVLQEKATAPYAIISRYQGSLPTLLGIHQPLLGRHALKKSSQLLFVTKCTMLHFVRKKRTVVKESRERWLWLFQHAVKETSPHPCHCRMIVLEVKETVGGLFDWLSSWPWTRRSYYLHPNASNSSFWKSNILTYLSFQWFLSKGITTVLKWWKYKRIWIIKYWNIFWLLLSLCFMDLEWMLQS